MVAILRCLTSLIALAASSAVALENVEFREWEVPYGQSRPRDPFAGSATSVWFVGQRAGYLAHLDAETNEFSQVELKTGSGPHNLIVAADGTVWYAGNRTGLIGRYDPATEEFEEIMMPDKAARDPHTLVFDQRQENIWFTVQGGNFVGRLTVAGRAVDLIPVPTAYARPYGIKLAPDGTPWVVLLGTNKLASIDPGTLALTEYVIPAAAARPRRLEVTSDGRIWYADYRRGYLGRYNPDSKTFSEWALPSGRKSRPYGMASDERDRVWVVETGISPNQFVGFDTHAERVISVTPIPSGAGSVRHMNYHAGTGTVWFGTDRSTLGRARVRLK